MLAGVQQVRRRIIFATAVFQPLEPFCQVLKTPKGLAYGNNAVKPLFRIHEILVWIRIRMQIRGSGSECGSGGPDPNADPDRQKTNFF
jgi:hypothetical protein